MDAAGATDFGGTGRLSRLSLRSGPVGYGAFGGVEQAAHKATEISTETDSLYMITHSLFENKKKNSSRITTELILAK